MKHAITTMTHLDDMLATVSHSEHRSTVTFGDILNNTTLHVPAHVAEHTAEAFNRAMQAERQPDGSLIYRTDQGAWHITLDLVMRKVWHFQNEEVTGDEDPHFLTGTAVSVIDAMDQIDALIDEHACPVCLAMVGERELNVCADGNIRCWACDAKWQERSAHTFISRAAGL